MDSPYASTAFLKLSSVRLKVYSGTNIFLFVWTIAKSFQKQLKACLTKAHASVDSIVSVLMLAMLNMIVYASFSATDVLSTVFMNFITILQNGFILRHSIKCNIVSTQPHPSLHLLVPSALRLGSLSYMLSALCSIFLQFFSSVASERGVPSVGHTMWKGMERPIAKGHFASQFGLLFFINVECE